MKSISNRQETLLRKLQRKKYREQEEQFLVEGERAILQVIENGAVEVEYLFFEEERQLWLDPEWEAYASHIPSAKVAPATFRGLADTDSPQGVIALCAMPGEAAFEQLAGAGGLLVATDRLQDPGNLGAVVRSSVWFGGAGLLLGKGTVDLFHPKVVRSTAGATGVLPYLNVNLSSALSWFEDNGWPVYLLDAATDAVDLATVSPPDKGIVVIGNEANGIDPALHGGRNRTTVRIPSSSGRGTGSVESLNAAIALSIGLYGLTER